MEYGSGALNVDGGRIGAGALLWDTPRGGIFSPSDGKHGEIKRSQSPVGRYPANLVLDEESAEMLDEQAGDLSQCGGPKKTTHNTGMFGIGVPGFQMYGDKGGPSRFFYCAKASRSERGKANKHPTVKPTALTKWLATLLLPPESVKPRRLLVPFAGSGSEMIGAIEAGWDEVVGVEQSEQYADINSDLAVQRPLIAPAEAGWRESSG